jgi:sugar phosphate isomerase/epimerase
MPSSDYGISTYAYTVTHTAEQCIDLLADHGFTSFELVMYPGHAWPVDMDAGARKRLKSFLSGRSLRLRSLNQPNIDLNIAAATREMRDYSIASLCRTIEFAGDLEVPDVLIGPGKLNGLVPEPRHVAIDHLHRALDTFVPLANEVGTRVLIENMPFGSVPDAGALVGALDAYGSPDIGIVYDLANGYFIGEDIRRALALCARRLKLIHVSDTGRHAYRHDPVGHGTMDFAALAQDLATIGWAESPMMEMVGTTDDPAAEFVETVAKLDSLGWSDHLVEPVA